MGLMNIRRYSGKAVFRMVITNQDKVFTSLCDLCDHYDSNKTKKSILQILLKFR